MELMEVFMLYTCECCDSIFEHEENDKAIRCPYCGRIKHDVWGPGYIATQLAVREASAEEVARYNLSGRPCAANEKGVQIIVYADFTTKTVINE